MNSKFCDTASITTIYPSIGTGAPLRIVHLDFLNTLNSFIFASTLFLLGARRAEE
jgi:hypothetical protein